MKRLHKVLAWAMTFLLAVPIPVRAQSEQPAPFNAEQLDQLAAPIALYPDPLLAQILMASTYPLEVVQAARFVKANQGLSGAKLDEALKNETWDDSVKSLVSFPQVLSLMDGKLDWTQKLGDPSVEHPTIHAVFSYAAQMVVVDRESGEITKVVAEVAN